MVWRAPSAVPSNFGVLELGILKLGILKLGVLKLGISSKGGVAKASSYTIRTLGFLG